MKLLPWYIQGVTSRVHSHLPIIALLALALATDGATFSAAAQAPLSATSTTATTTATTATTTATTATTTASMSLRQAYDAALARLPEARSVPQRRSAAAAQERAAQAWTPEPPAFESGVKTDRIGTNRGSREWVAGVAVPLWLPGQRDAARSLAQAETAALDQTLGAAAWRVAGELRQAWWSVQAAQVELDLVRTRLANAQRLAADVAGRVRAGDLARADQHQADGAVAAAQVELSSTQRTQVLSWSPLRRLAGPLPGADLQATPEPLPAELTSATVSTTVSATVSTTVSSAAHPALRDLAAQAEIARRYMAQARLQRRAAPEIAFAAARARGSSGEAFGQSITIGLRIPFGADDRHQAQVASAEAQLTDAETRLGLERERIEADIELARTQVDLARGAVDGAQRRALLAREAQGFVDKAFRLGEIDLPARLRIELEAVEAERQSARARVELAQAISQWRQALGLSPV